MRPYQTKHTEQKFCANCGKQNPTTNKYCFECGFEIPEISFFPQNNSTQLQSDREQNQQSQSIDYSSKAKKTRGYGWLIFFLALAALFIFTNPDEKMHLDFIRKSITAKIIDKSSPWGVYFTNLTKVGIGDANINNYLNTYCKRTNYIFFSLAEIQVEEKWEIMAVGLLGNIFAWEEFKNKLDIQLTQVTQVTHNFEGIYKFIGYGNLEHTNELFSANVEKKENDNYVITIKIGMTLRYQGNLEGNKLVFYIGDGQIIEITGDTFDFMMMKFTKIK